MARTRVLIVDDHALVRRGLREMISAEDEFEVCGEADDFDAALTAARDARPDLALVDISLPSGSGLELAKQLLSINKELRILFVSMHDDAVFAERALRAGALGYINKSRPGEELLAALQKVARGEIALCHEVAERLMRRGISPSRERATGLESLSDRELEIFELIGRGMSTRDIAERLSLSVKTVETHRENIKTKLDVGSASELTHQATLWKSGQS